MRKIISPKTGVIGSIFAILIITVLEFPAPIGFETRPQGNVSVFWLFLFLAILISEISALVLVFKGSSKGWKFGIAAAILNILQVAADLLHLMQPEVAPAGYIALEGIVVVLSLALIYFSLKLHNKKFGFIL